MPRRKRAPRLWRIHRKRLNLKLHLYPLELPLRHVFRTSKVERHVQQTLIVCLEEDGHRGYGECTENAFFGAHLGSIVKEIEGIRALLEASPSPEAPEVLYELLIQRGLSSFARCAVDVAFHDLRGKQTSQTLYQKWGLKEKPLISSYTIGLGRVEEMQEKIKEKPWPVYKIKLGQQNDLSIVRALRQVTDSTFRVDVNGAWTLKESIQKINLLSRLGVEFVEQPLARELTEEQSHLYEVSSLPLIADESCANERELQACSKRFQGVNIKLMKCGGLTPALAMIKQARALGLATMVGCMVESSVGISAIAQLVPLLDYVDMDGALLLSEDPATGVEVHPTGLAYGSLAGTGASLKHL